MIWPFSRKPKPLNPGPINEDWAPGDLAERIQEGQWDGDGTAQLRAFVAAGGHVAMRPREVVVDGARRVRL